MDFLGKIDVLRRRNNGVPKMTNPPASIVAPKMINLRGLNRQPTPADFLGKIDVLSGRGSDGENDLVLHRLNYEAGKIANRTPMDLLGKVDV